MPYKDPEKQKEAQRKSHEKLREQRRAADRIRKEEGKQKIRDLKESNPCADCGKHYPFYVMQFDHVRGEKEGGIAQFVSNRQWKRAWAEIEKCDIVCANCHSSRTYERQPLGEEHPGYVF